MTGVEATDQIARALAFAAEFSAQASLVHIEHVEDLGPRALEVRFSDGTTAVVTVNVE